jgi:lysophospholipase L1-like esterase
MDFLKMNFIIAILLIVSVKNLYAASIGEQLAPGIHEKLQKNEAITILFLGDSNTAGCGTSDYAGNKTIPGLIASRLANEYSHGNEIGVVRIDRDAFRGQTVDAELCRAYKERTIAVKQGSSGVNHILIRDGLGGATSQRLLEQSDQTLLWLRDHRITQIDLLVLMVGINDSIIQRGNSPEDFERNVRKLIEKLNDSQPHSLHISFKEILLVTSFSNGSIIAGKADGAGHPFISIREDSTCEAALKSKKKYLNGVCDLALYNKRLQSISKTSAENVYYLDIAGLMLQSAGFVAGDIDLAVRRKIRRWMTKDDVFHPNDAGYQMMADRIFQTIFN